MPTSTLAHVASTQTAFLSQPVLETALKETILAICEIGLSFSDAMLLKLLLEVAYSPDTYATPDWERHRSKCRQSIVKALTAQIKAMEQLYRRLHANQDDSAICPSGWHLATWTAFFSHRRPALGDVILSCSHSSLLQPVALQEWTRGSITRKSASVFNKVLDIIQGQAVEFMRGEDCLLDLGSDKEMPKALTRLLFSPNDSFSSAATHVLNINVGFPHDCSNLLCRYRALFRISPLTATEGLHGIIREGFELLLAGRVLNALKNLSGALCNDPKTTRPSIVVSLLLAETLAECCRLSSSKLDTPSLSTDERDGLTSWCLAVATQVRDMLRPLSCRELNLAISDLSIQGTQKKRLQDLTNARPPPSVPADAPPFSDFCRVCDPHPVKRGNDENDVYGPPRKVKKTA